MADLDAVARDYRAAFQRYLPHRSEAALTAGYELGRDAVDGGVSLLDLVGIHHRVLLEVLEGSRPDAAAPLVQSAALFLSEVLGSFDMTHRGLTAHRGSGGGEQA